MSKHHQRKKKRTIKKEVIINNKSNLDLKKLTLIFLLSRLILIIFIIIQHDSTIFELFDSKHYLTIAKSGYTEPMMYAFFPLYPMIIKIFTYIIPSYHIIGFLVSNIASFLSLLLLHNMTKDKDNLFIILGFIFTPILGYTSLLYTESLYLLFTLLGYYLYKKDKYVLSAIVVGLSILTRNSGVILWGAIGLDMLYRLFTKKDRPIKFKTIVIFGIISLLIGMIYPIYLYIETGDFLKFISVQPDYWNKASGTPIHNFLSDLVVLKRDTESLPTNLITFIENWFFFIFAFIIGIKLFKKDKTSSIYMIVSLILFTTTFRDVSKWKTLASISLFRYVLGLFPIYLYALDSKKENTKRIIFLIFVILSVFNATIIYSGGFMG